MAGSPDVISALGGVSLFSGLDKKLHKAIAERGKELSYKSGDTIVRQGDMGLGFYLLLDGKVEIRKGERLLATLSKGQFFGEMSLIDEAPRMADVVAVQPTRCFALMPWAFTSLVKKNPEVAIGMLKELAKRLRTAQSSPTS